MAPWLQNDNEIRQTERQDIHIHIRILNAILTLPLLCEFWRDNLQKGFLALLAGKQKKIKL